MELQQTKDFNSENNFFQGQKKRKILPIICDDDTNKGICPISKEDCPGVCIYSDVMENVNLGIIIFDIQNECVEFQNKLAASFFKDTIEKKDFNNLYALLIPEPDNIKVQQSSYNTNPLKYNDRILGYTNYKISNRFIMTLILDITEKERLESIAAAINTMNNIGYIFSGIRHEIGNPLNSIKMTTSVLKLKIDSFSKETVLSYIDRIQKETSRIEYLLLSLKSFNVYENPKMEKVDIFLFLKKFISLASTDIKKNNITINLKSYSKDNHGITDPRALHQVLINLVTNAVDSLKEKEKPEIVLSIRRKKEHLVLSVIDNGCGIPHDSQKELFKPFFTNKPDGTGLGLVIVKKLLAKMNSTIHIQSCEKIGTTVIINIPIKHNELVAQEKYITDTC